MIMQIVVMDKLDYCATMNNLTEVKDLPNFRFVKGSIQSLDLVAHVLESEKIDTVMHFAAQVRSPTSGVRSLQSTAAVALAATAAPPAPTSIAPLRLQLATWRPHTSNVRRLPPVPGGFIEQSQGQAMNTFVMRTTVMIRLHPALGDIDLRCQSCLHADAR